MTPTQALEILVHLCKQAPVPFGAHLQAQQAVAFLEDYIALQQAGDKPKADAPKPVEAKKPVEVKKPTELKKVK